MTIHCPHCLTGYVLPERLLGAGGARVRCPGCQEVFIVLPEGEAAGEGAEGEAPVLPEATSDMVSEATAVAAPAAAPSREPTEVATSVLAVMADFLGDALTQSRSRGTVLSDHGPAIIAVWDEYRRRAGEDAPSGVFRAALRDRCGVDLSRRNGS